MLISNGPSLANAPIPRPPMGYTATLPLEGQRFLIGLAFAFQAKGNNQFLLRKAHSVQVCVEELCFLNEEYASASIPDWAYSARQNTISSLRDNCANLPPFGPLRVMIVI